MAKKKAISKNVRAASEAPVIPLGPPAGVNDLGAETTGRFIVIFKDAADTAAIRSTLTKSAGIRDVVASADYTASAVAADDLADSNAVHFHQLGIALVAGEEAVQSLATASSQEDSN